MNPRIFTNYLELHELETIINVFKIRAIRVEIRVIRG